MRKTNKKNRFLHHHRPPRRPIHRNVLGAAPGTLTPVPGAPRPTIHLLALGPDKTEYRPIEHVAEIKDYLGAWPTVWVQVIGLGDLDVIKELAALLSIHDLALEDVLDGHQRPKIEAYPPYLFIIAKIVELGETLDTSQLSIFLGPGLVLSFQEKPNPAFDSLRDRLRQDPGRARQTGADYLAYTLLDTIVDAYYPVLEQYGDRLENMEDQVLRRPEQQTVMTVVTIKRELLRFRRAAWPLREVLNYLLRDNVPGIHPATRVYIQDCYDHNMQIVDLLEAYRELASGLMEVYLSNVSYRMDQVMKVLTIISTIFIPLSFIASLYGMNFQTAASPWNMPELAWRYGYPYALGLMLLVALTMLFFFVRRGWIHPLRVRDRDADTLPAAPG